jgi:hypothetical protein
MAAQDGILISALFRVATNAGNPTAFLTDVITGRYTRVLAGNGRVTISTSSGGSAASFTIPQGFNDLDLVQTAEMALRMVETGINQPIQTNAAGTNVLPVILPNRAADQGVSYGVFSTIAR